MIEDGRYGNRCVDLGNFCNAECGADGLCGFLTRGDDGLAVGQLLQEIRNVRWFYDLEELVRGIVLQSADGGGGVEEGEALLLAERHDVVYLEALGLQIHEMVFVTKEYLSLDPPVVVDEIGIIEVHTPPLALRRETA